MARPLKSDEKKNDKETLDKWLSTLYDVESFDPKLFDEVYAAFSYQGFNRDEVLKQLMDLVKDPKIVHEIILTSALRGPRAGSQLVLSNGKTPERMGIPASGLKGRKGLSMSKIVASTADIAAFILKKCNVPKRMNVELPGWLQFPAAGSIRLPSDLRLKHIEFSKQFSKLIKGEFNEGIYEQMEMNSYLDPKLKLFN